ncbi:MAG: sigma-70 family RNA polymerase sigma factor, partial [Acidobacteriota bacterium]|nr:sigma-70 family RNA polymerase sigma factor [Acidobacteriota bacterium]
EQHLPLGASVVTLDEPGEARDSVDALLAPMSDYELVACVRETLKTLPAQYRAILLLKRTEGYTLEEISQMLEMTLGQVSGKLYVAEEMFRLGLHEGRPPAQGTTREALPPGSGNTSRNKRGQSTDHHSTSGLYRARDWQPAHRILFRTRQRIGAAIGRSAFAGM